MRRVTKYNFTNYINMYIYYMTQNAIIGFYNEYTSVDTDNRGLKLFLESFRKYNKVDLVIVVTILPDNYSELIEFCKKYNCIIEPIILKDIKTLNYWVPYKSILEKKKYQKLKKILVVSMNDTMFTNNPFLINCKKKLYCAAEKTVYNIQAKSNNINSININTKWINMVRDKLTNVCVLEQYGKINNLNLKQDKKKNYSENCIFNKPVLYSGSILGTRNIILKLFDWSSNLKGNEQGMLNMYAYVINPEDCMIPKLEQSDILTMESISFNKELTKNYSDGFILNKLNNRYSINNRIDKINRKNFLILANWKKIEQRFNYYIKNWQDKQTITIPEYAKKFKQNELIYYTGPNTPVPENFTENNWNTSFWWKGWWAVDIPCLTISADGIDNHDLPAIVKVRYIDNPKGGIIGPLNYIRHWDLIKKIKSHKVEWDNKKADCIWRGVPTGIQNSNNLRIGFCHRWLNKFDVGITKTWNIWDAIYLKPSIHVYEMLNYKYIISIPGNDKDSGLNWKLASNSIVLMAPPKIESWLMEGLLKPWFHYVPLADDYSDLDKIVDWCRNNDKKCQEIVKNANNFMEQFRDIEIEIKIFDMIKKHYQTTFKFI